MIQKVFEVRWYLSLSFGPSLFAICPPVGSQRPCENLWPLRAMTSISSSLSLVLLSLPEYPCRSTLALVLDRCDIALWQNDTFVKLFPTVTLMQAWPSAGSNSLSLFTQEKGRRSFALKKLLCSKKFLWPCFKPDRAKLHFQVLHQRFSGLHSADRFVPHCWKQFTSLASKKNTKS